MFDIRFTFTFTFNIRFKEEELLDDLKVTFVARSLNTSINSSVHKPSKCFRLIPDRFFVTLCAIVTVGEKFLLENCH